MKLFALGLGLATKNSHGKIIEVFFAKPLLHPEHKLVAELAQSLAYQGGEQVFEIADRASLAKIFAQSDEMNAALAQQAVTSEQPLVLVMLEHDKAPTSIAEAFLKLQLLSHRLVAPHQVVLDGIFGLLHNLAWTNQGAIDLPELAERQLQARLKGETLLIDCVDKFPKMVDYVVPQGVRIADTSRVRLGAHVGEGTTVMHEGFINFNAGTLGVSMVEGRISSGVVVGKGSDIGGGASIMGTLSGGGKVVVSIGENSLLGANGGLGFPLGDRCTIESGLYVTAGTKVTLLDENGQEYGMVKARDLAGKPDLLFRRNSVSGKIECLTNRAAVELNSQLHKN
ncbi:MAG: 2,3,4,5-tetrahydropyridine-2,6-dicarboxylate N-succinyltransferase [Vibrionaceae bacterium]